MSKTLYPSVSDVVVGFSCICCYYRCCKLYTLQQKCFYTSLCEPRLLWENSTADRQKDIESRVLAPYPEFSLSQRLTGHGQRVNYNSDLQIGVRVRLRVQVFFTEHAL